MSRMGIAAVVAALALAGSPSTVAAQELRSPVECDGCIGWWYYFDHGFSRDWNCGSATYSGHTGSDYSLNGGNRAIDDDNAVVAMGAGTVVKAEDGYFDRCTQCGGANCGTGFGNGFANQVVINHGDYRMIYGHMKSGSIAVAEGDTVECGQLLGFIGSSGCSTGAHLHIEPSDAASFGTGRYTPIDPYVGECSPTAATLFLDQGAYRQMPGTECGEPPVPACPPDTFDVWTCSEDLALRRRCLEGVVSEEPCEWGCTPAGTDDVCGLPPDADGDGARADVDCDDADGGRHAGALEVCGDGIDQDCSGDDLACPPEPVPMPAVPPAGVTPGAAGTGAAPTGATSSPVTGQPAAPPPIVVGPVAQPRQEPEDEGCRVVPAGGAGWLQMLALVAWVITCTRRRRA